MKKQVIIIGGGAAGAFAAAILAEKAPDLEVTVLEKTDHLLSKVRISGGGRCNVTHAEFDPKKPLPDPVEGGGPLVIPRFSS